MAEPLATAENRQRLVKLFEFLKAYTDMRFPPVRDVTKQPKFLWLSTLPSHPAVEVFFDSGESQDGGEDADVVLRVSRPTLTTCPAPPPELSSWLKPGWKEIPGRAEPQESRNVVAKDGSTLIERFEDFAERPFLFRTWKRQREQWVTNERPARNSLVIFQLVYEWYGMQEREGEKVELLVGDGLFRYGTGDEAFNHPVLLQKLELEFHPDKKAPEFVFRKREQPPLLYIEMLRAVPHVDNRQLARCANELKEVEFSPLGREDTTGFLRRLIQGLFPNDGSFVDDDKASSKHSAAADRTEISSPADAEDKSASKPTNSTTIERLPVIFMRNRRTGPSNIFDQVLEDIATREWFPSSLLQILGFATKQAEEPEAVFAEGPSSGSNQDGDILFSKPANPEQLKIARQLERKDCVLVQGPPGTGKTHTIANLLGHLLAQGKRVLVTAHTPKALRVLREKVVDSLQPLCISVLQNERKSQEELQVAVRQIHQRLAGDDSQMEREAARLSLERARLVEALDNARRDLLNARLSEIREIVHGGKAECPIDAARIVRNGTGKHDWIPAPVALGELMPLSASEVQSLYQTNGRVSVADERELDGVRPDFTALPTPSEFRALANELEQLSMHDTRFREELWGELRFSRNFRANQGVCLGERATVAGT